MKKARSVLLTVYKHTLVKGGHASVGGTFVVCYFMLKSATD